MFRETTKATERQKNKNRQDSQALYEKTMNNAYKSMDNPSSFVVRERQSSQTFSQVKKFTCDMTKIHC